MKVLPETIMIYDHMHKPIGQLTPWDIQLHHGHINQVMYIFEYKKYNEFHMSIEEPGDAHKYFFDVNNNIEQQFPDSFTRPGLMRPVLPYGIMEEEEVHKPSILDKKFITSQDTKTTESAKDFVESNLKYEMTVSTEEMIRRFLHLPMQTYLIMWVRKY